LSKKREEKSLLINKDRKRNEKSPKNGDKPHLFLSKQRKSPSRKGEEMVDEK